MPKQHHATDTERLEARISAEQKRLLKNAAAIAGRTLTDFVVHAAYEAAVRMIRESQQLHLSLNDRDVFIQALLNPPAPSPQLLKAAKKYTKDIESQ